MKKVIILILLIFSWNASFSQEKSAPERIWKIIGVYQINGDSKKVNVRFDVSNKNEVRDEMSSETVLIIPIAKSFLRKKLMTPLKIKRNDFQKLVGVCTYLNPNRWSGSKSVDTERCAE